MKRLEQHDAPRRGSARLHRIDWERIGSQIRKYRRREHLRQRDLAARISSTTNTISRLEGGGIGCSLECLLEICNALSVSPDALLFGNFSPESSSFHDYFMNMKELICQQVQENIEHIFLQVHRGGDSADRKRGPGKRPVRFMDPALQKKQKPRPMGEAEPDGENEP